MKSAKQMGTTGVLITLHYPKIPYNYPTIPCNLPTIPYNTLTLKYLIHVPDLRTLPYNTLHTTDITHTRVHGGSVQVDKMSVFFDCETQTLGTSHDITVMPLNHVTPSTYYYACYACH